ncbi:TMEM165/GDT1 family protein [Parasphingorhabdus sp.]|uniref:TMEM165/GDT1 family protein n=1 Tax=Parasphingorhabdus sp. TaxID=2709688 RepID=UPI0010FD63D0
MDAFLTTLFAMVLAEFGDRPQILCAALAMRYGRNGTIIWALGLATLLNCLISAIAGAAINGWISEEPLQLFYALSLIFAGLGMVAWRRRVDLLENWTLGPFWTSFIGLFILQFGDKGQFIVAATAARTDMPLLTAAGAWLGIMIACVPAVFLQRKLAELIPIGPLRYVGGALFLLVGLVLALGAWGII